MSEKCLGPVLVVDDDADIRETLCELIRLEGYDTVGAENGQVALDTIRGGPQPCVILLDLMMPVMDGWEFCRERAADEALGHIPVVVITASGRADVPGVEAVLPKPLAIETVLGAVERHCAQRQTAREAHQAEKNA
jgi:two-component system, chemotaxis family, chemotaxis protein CheY